MIRVSQPEPNKLRGPGNLDVFSSVWSRLVGKNNLGETVCGAHTHDSNHRPASNRVTIRRLADCDWIIQVGSNMSERETNHNKVEKDLRHTHRLLVLMLKVLS